MLVVCEFTECRANVKPTPSHVGRLSPAPTSCSIPFLPKDNNVQLYSFPKRKYSSIGPSFVSSQTLTLVSTSIRFDPLEWDDHSSQILLGSQIVTSQLENNLPVTQNTPKPQI